MNRREFLIQSILGIGSVSGIGGVLSGCSTEVEQIKIGSNVFPGYEFLFLARERQFFDPKMVRMVELPSSSVCLESLATGGIDGACLTLDEVLTARDNGLDLKIVTILDVSLGADMLLAKPDIRSIADLKGKRIGVEKSAVGAVMLYSALEKVGLGLSDFNVIHLNVNRHKDAYLNGDVEALVTFEPVVSQLKERNLSLLFSSEEIPGRIVDVIAMRPEAIEKNPFAIRALVTGHFKALDEFKTTPGKAAPILARRMKINEKEVAQVYQGIDLPDITKNRLLMQGPDSTIETNAGELAKIMLSAGMLSTLIETTGLVDDRFLPVV